MSYEIKEWKKGDVIQAEDLNRIEQGITDASIVPTPTVEDVGKILGVGDDGKYALEEKGYSCTEETTLLTDESVTLEIHEGEAFATGLLAYRTPITADTIRVTINGTEYECERQVLGDSESAYGADTDSDPLDWSEYPFSIESDRFGNTIAVPSAGTYQVKLETVELSTETTECFKKAVNEAVIPNIVVINQSSLGTPTVGNVQSNTVAYSVCGTGDQKTDEFFLWDGYYAYQGQPIVIIGNQGIQLADSFSKFEVCPSDEVASDKGEKLALQESTSCIGVGFGEEYLSLLPSDAKFYTYGAPK